MNSHYSYDLSAFASQGNHPQPPVFTNNFLYRPQVTIMEAYNADGNSPLPAPAVLTAAKAQAQNIRDNRIHFPAELEENSYMGVDHADMPSSRQLSNDAQMGYEVPTYFDDFLTAEFYRGSLRPNKRVEDPTIPKTVQAMKLHVDLLVRAFKSINDVDDNPGMIKPFETRRHDSKLVECMCWNLVKACVFRAKSDEPLLTAYEPHKAKNSTGLDTFEKRFDAIAIALSRSKTLCKHLYDAPFLNTFVDDPLKSIRRVDSNRDLNKQKATVMAKGKAALGQDGTKGKKGKKRSATTAELEESDATVPVQTSTASSSTVGRSHVSAPVEGRMTRRMSRILAENGTSPLEASSPGRSMPTSSPTYSDTEVKYENTSAQPTGYIVSGNNGVNGYGMRTDAYDHSVMTGVSVPNLSYRYHPTLPIPYPYAVNHDRNPYATPVYPTFARMPSAVNSVNRNGPMQPEEVTSSTQGYVVNPYAHTNGQGDEADDE